MAQAEIIIYTHGKCLPTDPGGWGVWAFMVDEAPHSKQAQRLSYGQAAVTGIGWDSGSAGLRAIIEALRWAYRSKHRNILVRCDNMSVVNWIYKIWSPNLLAHITACKTIQTAMTYFDSVAIETMKQADNGDTINLAGRAWVEAQAIQDQAAHLGATM